MHKYLIARKRKSRRNSALGKMQRLQETTLLPLLPQTLQLPTPMCVTVWGL